jgi:hypothetical protein
VEAATKKEENTLFPYAIVWGAIGLWLSNAFEGGLNGWEGFLLFFTLGILIPITASFLEQWIRQQIKISVREAIKESQLYKHDDVREE